MFEQKPRENTAHPTALCLQPHLIFLRERNAHPRAGGDALPANVSPPEVDSLQGKEAQDG